MHDLGFNFWLMWYPDAAGTWSYEKNREFIRSVDAWCAKHDMEWMLNTLSTVWNNSPEHCIDRTRLRLVLSSRRSAILPVPGRDPLGTGTVPTSHGIDVR